MRGAVPPSCDHARAPWQEALRRDNTRLTLENRAHVSSAGTTSALDSLRQRVEKLAEVIQEKDATVEQYKVRARCLACHLWSP